MKFERWTQIQFRRDITWLKDRSENLLQQRKRTAPLPTPRLLALFLLQLIRRMRFFVCLGWCLVLFELLCVLFVFLNYVFAIALNSKLKRLLYQNSHLPRRKVTSSLSPPTRPLESTKSTVRLPKWTLQSHVIISAICLMQCLPANFTTNLSVTKGFLDWADYAEGWTQFRCLGVQIPLTSATAVT